MRTSEEQLRAMMVKGMDGDAAAHGALLRLLVPLLRSFYRRRVHDGDEDIEDLVQETLIAIHTRRASYDRDRAFTAWLFASALQDGRPLSPSTPHGPDRTVGRHPGRRRVRRRQLGTAGHNALASRPPGKQAEAIRHTKIDGLSVAEAAEKAGIGESDVKVSVHRGLKTLAARIRGVRQ